MTVNIEEAPTTTAIVHPLVLLSVVDHYNRVAKNTKKRVVGVLLGQQTPNRVNIANSFALPFEEDEKDPSIWFLDHNYLESLFHMFKKINASEKIVGWYHTGPKLKSSDLAIHQLIQDYCKNPVLVIINVENTSSIGLPTNAYLAIEELSQDGTQKPRVTFTNIPSEIQAEESEEIGVEHLLRDVKDDTLGSLSTKMTQTLTSLKGLSSHLKTIHQYLGHVVDGKLPMKQEILILIQQILSQLNQLNLDDEESQKSLQTSTNDQLAILYLGSLVRSVLALHQLIDNRYENQQAELSLAKESKSKEETKAKEEPKAEKAN